MDALIEVYDETVLYPYVGKPINKIDIGGTLDEYKGLIVLSVC